MSKATHSTLASSVQVMNEALAELGHQLAETDSSDPSTDLAQVIRRPGWTTIAEEMLVESMVTVITQHAKALAHAHKSLVSGALAVGR